VNECKPLDPGLVLPEAGEPRASRSGFSPEKPDPLGKYNPAHMRFTERFFYLHYYKFLSGPAKYVILIVFAGLFAGGAALWVRLS
jgi:hypothetical protein